MSEVAPIARLARVLLIPPITTIVCVATARLRLHARLTSATTVLLRVVPATTFAVTASPLETYVDNDCETLFTL